MQQYNFARYIYIYSLYKGEWTTYVQFESFIDPIYIYIYIFTTNNHMHVRDEEILLILQFRLPRMY